MKTKRFTLSKSSLIRGKKCSKSLYFHKEKYNSESGIDQKSRAKYERGLIIGQLAQQLFPGGVDVSTSGSSEDALAATQRCIEEKCPVIYQATFKLFDLIVKVDILTFTNEMWRAYEVKSSPRISSVYLFDAAIQHYVIEQSGIPLKDFSIIHINDKYERNGTINVSELFSIKSVKRRLKKMNSKVANSIESAKEVISADQPPEIPIGRQCLKPYPCDYKSKCWSNEEEESILSYVGLPITVKFDQFKKGNRQLEQLDLDNLKIGYKSLTKIKASIVEQTIVEKNKLSTFLKKRSSRLYFFDIEATQSAVPLYEGSKPFQMIPFLYSLHTMDRTISNAKLKHTYFICRPKEDDRVAMVEHFLEHTEEEGDIIVFNTYLEKQALQGFAQLCPQHRTAIENRIKRLVDLETPFKEMWYYHPSMQCSHSLKSVLPCLVKDMNYADFEVKDGLEAMLSYQALIDHEESKVEVERRLKNLVEYCQMDTFALFKIFESLEELVID